MARIECQEVDEDLPGAGQHYCVSCDRHFVNEQAKQGHQKTKGFYTSLTKLK
jgi:hypothetical protein